jgi:hypothetical protein
MCSMPMCQAHVCAICGVVYQKVLPGSVVGVACLCLYHKCADAVTAHCVCGGKSYGCVGLQVPSIGAVQFVLASSRLPVDWLGCQRLGASGARFEGYRDESEHRRLLSAHVLVCSCASQA